MTDQYDWSKLDAGWKLDEGGLQCIVKGIHAYWFQRGVVTDDGIDGMGNPEDAYQFHTAAREQVAKCRVPDWEARCKELESERDALVEEVRVLTKERNSYYQSSIELNARLDSRDWQKLTEENEQLRAKLSAPDVDTGIWVCARLREDIWHSEKRCSYDDAVEWLRPMHAIAVSVFPIAAWNALVRSGRAR